MPQVNNAGIFVIKKSTEHTFEDYSTIMCTNIESSYHLCQLAHPLLKASGNGSIIFMSSVAGLVSLPRLSVYAASKGMSMLEYARTLKAFTRSQITKFSTIIVFQEQSTKFRRTWHVNGRRITFV